MKTHKILFAIGIMVSFGLRLSIAEAAVDMFLDFPDSDIVGESQDANHTDEIDVLAWSWGLATDSAASGKGTNVSIQDLSVTKWVDSATSSLIMKSLLGENIGRAVLTIRKAGETPLEYIVITMYDVSVSSFATGGSGGEDRLTENVSLRFGSIQFEYVPQNPDGSAGAAISFGWDIRRND